MCISKLRSNELYSSESWRIGIQRFGGTHQKFLGCIWYETKIRERKGQSGGSIQKGEPHERNPCAPRFEEQPLEETSRQAGCNSNVAWNLARKICKLKAQDKDTCYSPVERKGARDTEDRMFDMDSGASMHNAERRRIKLRYNGYFEKVQKKQKRLTATGSSANKRVSTSFCS